MLNPSECIDECFALSVIHLGLISLKLLSLTLSIHTSQQNKCDMTVCRTETDMAADAIHLAVNIHAHVFA
jgi:hypothetical protein